MPNWAYNTVAIHSHDPHTIAELALAVVPEDASDPDTNYRFDFNRILPVPTELMNTSSPVRVMEDEEYQQLLADNDDPDNDPTMITYGQQQQRRQTRIISRSEANRRIRAYGHLDWYDYAINAWGTKWSGTHARVYHHGPHLLILSFETAWSAPTGIYNHLCDTHGATIVGGVIHEDGDEFEEIHYTHPEHPDNSTNDDDSNDSTSPAAPVDFHDLFEVREYYTREIYDADYAGGVVGGAVTTTEISETEYQAGLTAGNGHPSHEVVDPVTGHYLEYSYWASREILLRDDQS